MPGTRKDRLPTARMRRRRFAAVTRDVRADAWSEPLHLSPGRGLGAAWWMSLPSLSSLTKKRAAPMARIDPGRPRKAAPASQPEAPLEHRLHGLRALALAEGKQFVVLFLYLWVLFGLYVLNERIILDQNGIDFVAHGFALFNAFVLAKVMLVAEHMNLSRWLNRRPLIYPILHDSLLFAIIFIVFHAIEKLVVTAVRGEAAAASIPNVGGGGIAGIVCVAVILFFTLMPFFAFRNFNRALGPERMNTMLFGSWTKP